MKQVAQNYKSGELCVVDVPRPNCQSGGVLVRTQYSLISSGTELMKVSESKLSLVGKARARPEQVAKVLEAAVQQGPMAAYQKAMNRLDSWTPLGYSLAGVVVDVGAGVDEFSVGDVVACAGNEFALHAEYNWVPKHLCVPVPDGLDPRQAAFGTVGAIALQGVRQAEVQLGDTACVIGLGLIGQLVVQLLAAAGVTVVGLDVVEERCRVAEKSGAALCAAPDADGVAAVEQRLASASGGLGADRVFLVAGGTSNGPVEIAARLARDRARVIDIGKCRLDLPWNAYYEKELDVRFSRSYGPGRYDPKYELEGVDYPAGYVRWTERRNIACFLDLIRSGSIDPEPLISGIHPVTEAPDVYAKLSAGELQGTAYLFDYPQPPRDVERPSTTVRVPPSDGLSASRPAGRPRSHELRIGFIGAGNYASSMLLPHLQGREDVQLAHVVTNKSLSAMNAQRKFGFATAGTEVGELLDDESIDAVFVVTRHSSHAALTCRALEMGKAVFVEKPLALTSDEVDRILTTVESSGNDRLMVGFNRRFAPLLVSMRDRFGPRPPGSFVRYLVNAGSLAPGSWYADADLEGSRFLGEGGHFIDTVSWWQGSDPVDVAAVAGGGPDEVHVTLRYDGGSIGTISYLTGGHATFPKETLDVNGAGRSARLDNFRKVTVWKGRRGRSERARPDKGQKAAIDAFISAVRAGASMPIPLSSLVATTRASIAVGSSLAVGQTPYR